MYYLLYADGYEIPSKVAFDPEEPSLGRISADSVAPPHSPVSIKLCLSRVEGNPALVNSDLFTDTTCDTPMKDGHISILRTDGPGLSPNEPMAIVQVENPVPVPVPTPVPTPVRVPVPSSRDGIYVIKNRVSDVYWSAGVDRRVYFDPITMEEAKYGIPTLVNKHSPIIYVFRS